MDEGAREKDSAEAIVRELQAVLFDFLAKQERQHEAFVVEREAFKLEREKHPRWGTNVERAAETVLNRRVVAIASAVAVIFIAAIVAQWGGLATAKQVQEMEMRLTTAIATQNQAIENTRQNAGMLAGVPAIEAELRNHRLQLDGIERRCCGENNSNKSAYSVRPLFPELRSLLSPTPPLCPLPCAEQPLSLVRYGGSQSKP